MPKYTKPVSPRAPRSAAKAAHAFLEDSWRAHNFLSFQYTRVIATDVMATLTPSTSAAPSRRLPRGRESRVRPNRERHFRVVTRAADPNASLPQALLEAVSKKFIDDVSGVASLFDDKPAKYPRPPTLPVAGNTLDFVRGGHETLLAWALEYGANPSGVHEVQMLGAGPILHVVDPQIARELMVAKADEFPDRGASAMARFFREDQAAFVNTTGEQWMAYRKIGIASVNGSALDRLAGKVAERSEALVAKWHEKSQNQKSGGRLEIDVDTEAQAVTLEVIHEALFSEMLCVIDEDPNAMRIARSFRQFNEANQDVMNDFLQLYQEFDTPDAIRRETHRARLRSHFDQRADARQALIEKTGNAKDAPQDLLTALLTARDPVPDVALTRDDINLTLTEMMVAGHDTTAATVACLLTLLAANPRALRRAKQEVHAVCLSLGGALPITVKEVSQLNYLDDCMKETMRLYPAVMIVLRKADDGVGGELGDGRVEIPKGAQMWISPYVMGRLPHLWGGDVEDTKRFRPERFAEFRDQGIKEPEAFMPFGGGPRVCLGSRFAMLEGKVTAAAILRDFDLELTPELAENINQKKGQLPISYAAGLMSFPAPLRLIATSDRKENAASGAR